MFWAGRCLICWLASSCCHNSSSSSSWHIPHCTGLLPHTCLTSPVMAPCQVLVCTGGSSFSGALGLRWEALHMFSTMRDVGAQRRNSCVLYMRASAGADVGVMLFLVPLMRLLFVFLLCSG